MGVHLLRSIEVEEAFLEAAAGTKTGGIGIAPTIDSKTSWAARSPER